MPTKIKQDKNKNLIPHKAGDPPGPGRPRGTGYKQKALQSFMGMLSGKDGEQFLAEYLQKFQQGAKKENTWQARFMAERLFKEDVLSEIDEWITRGEKRELAFLHYQLHKSASDVQQAVLFSRKKYLALMAGRRGGKSEALRLWFADEFIDNPSARCLYIGLTLTTAMGLLWQPILDTFAQLGIKIKSHNRIEGMIVTEADGVMKFGGNTTKDEREKNRGPWWDRVAVDECQSQKDLRYLVESIISPTLIDKNGQIALCGTGPRTRGTYWESFFLGAWADGSPLYPDALRLNWNLSQNPFIPDFEKQLENIRNEKALSETDPLYVREYLGRIAYDDDALVLRLGAQNEFTDAELAAWIAAQPVSDVHFSAGLDFGFEDADALEIVCYSTTRPERFVVYEWKANRQGTAELAVEVKKGIAYVNTSPLFAKVVNKDFYIHADTGGNAITPYDLSQAPYNLPIQAAYKQEKAMAVEMLQDECRRGVMKFRKGGVIWDEALHTIYKRNEQDQLTREVDDETYHPDGIPALQYGMRPVWLFGGGET